ncbi:hypothetical protein RYA05_03595 [Pseudomonas syringae pv. actinidiae]|nr:hypothetical protein [Pseudomonas syringae pv. actinidiae]
MKQVFIALIAALSIGATSMALAEGSGDGGLRTQEISEAKAKVVREAYAKREAEKQVHVAKVADASKKAE